MRAPDASPARLHHVGALRTQVTPRATPRHRGADRRWLDATPIDVLFVHTVPVAAVDIQRTMAGLQPYVDRACSHPPWVHD